MSSRGSVVCLPAYSKWSVAGRRLSDISSNSKLLLRKSFVVSQRVLGYELLLFLIFDYQPRGTILNSSVDEPGTVEICTRFDREDIM
jgi:hypothetical protein